MGNIDKIIIQDKSDPRALRILDEVNKRAKKIHPNHWIPTILNRIPSFLLM
jgi:hypothetical protein